MTELSGAIRQGCAPALTSAGRCHEAVARLTAWRLTGLTARISISTSRRCASYAGQLSG
jgi:hypothetical protein